MRAAEEKQKRKPCVGTLLFLAQRKYIDATLPWRCLNMNADGEGKSHDKLRSKERKLIRKHFHSQGQQRYENRSTTLGMVFKRSSKAYQSMSVGTLKKQNIYHGLICRMVSSI